MPPGTGSAEGRKFLAPPYYSQRAVFASPLSAFFIHCAACPADFTYISSVDGCYRVVTHNLEWSVAGLHCRSLHKDAHLLVINNAQEQAAVAAALESTNRQCFTFCFYIIAIPKLRLSAVVVASP